MLIFELILLGFLLSLRVDEAKFLGKQKGTRSFGVCFSDLLAILPLSLSAVKTRVGLPTFVLFLLLISHAWCEE